MNKEKVLFSMEVDMDDYIYLEEDDEWDLCPQIFNKNKRDVQEDIKHDIKRAKDKSSKAKAEGDALAAGMFNILASKLEKLQKLIDYAPMLPMPRKSGWSYYVRTTSEGVTLELWHECDLRQKEIQDEDEYEEWEPTAVDATWLIEKVEPKYLTVSEFAKQYEVEPVTVRQWIRRGKIRNAKKAGSEWRISELAVPLTERGYKEGGYHWDKPLVNVPEEYDFLNSCSGISFKQDETDKKKYRAVFFSDTGKNIREFNTSEREKLEYYLISNPEVIANETYISLLP